MRKKREQQKNIILYVEGDTEKNYFSEFKKREKEKLKISIEKIDNMGGGGYSNFLEKLKKSAPEYGYLAIFIIIDLDKINNPGEKKKLEELINYCKTKNKQKSIPHFLIGTNEDFEYFACCHCDNYNNSDVKKFVTQNLPYRTVEELKADKNVFYVLNRDGRSYEIANKKFSKKGNKFYIFNDYSFQKASMDIKIKNILINEEALTCKHSNIHQFFNIIFS
ncbi:RloB domain-containing protein [Clostridium perfringens]|uniref:RloB domain-containing protein n=1 Tax=Clostridium perfringens TaxID=1502 RepID=UPI001C853725|nr:RloB domain-containing protein [Clostridium perfringens]